MFRCAEFLFFLSGSNQVWGKMIFLDENTSWWCIDGKLMHTEDGWKTREIQKISDSGARVCNIFFSRYEKGLALDENFMLYRSCDGGKTWKPDENFKNRHITDFYFIDENNGWIASMEDYGPVMFITDDGGTTWKEANVENYLQNLTGITEFQFVDKNNGWLIGNYKHESSSGSFVYHTGDGGISWERQEKSFISLYSVYFIDKNNGWTAGEGGTVLYTEDGGINWEKQSICEYGLFDVYFTDENNGWTAGNNGTVYHTDNGIDWTSVDLLPFQYTQAFSVYFKDSKTGWIEYWSHGSYYITGTKDGGATWEDITELPYQGN